MTCIGAGKAPKDAAHQSVLIDLAGRLKLNGFVDCRGRALYKDYADYIVRHERRPGIGPLAGFRGPAGDRTGRGSLKVRARWKIEDLARGQWQLVVNELPPGVSTQRVLEEIEALTNPQVKAGKIDKKTAAAQLKAWREAHKKP